MSLPSFEQQPVEPSETAIQGLGETGLAEVIDFPHPQLSVAQALYEWNKSNEAAGYGKFGYAEYKRDEDGLYVDHHGVKVYLAD